MKNDITIFESLQIILTEEEVEKITESCGYIVVGRKITVYKILKYLLMASIEECESYRGTVLGKTTAYGLEKIDHSSLSTRVAELPYKVFKEIFELIVSKLNRETRRSLKIHKKILAVDSTTITTSKTQMKWAGFHGQRSGIKLHVQLAVDAFMPTKVEESLAKRHDSTMADKLIDPMSIVVEDRAYGKIDRFDKYLTDLKQSFVIRIKDSLNVIQAKSIKRIAAENTKVISDVTCYLGIKKQSKNRFRVVTFKDYKGKTIRVCTDLMELSAETIAEIYKMRWKVETFFRTIKQNLNLSKIFGTTENAVYNQLYAALIAYVLIRYLYVEVDKRIRYTKLSMIEFIRNIRNNEFSTEVYIIIQKIIKKFLICSQLTGSS
jgi:hypothetical protein